MHSFRWVIRIAAVALVSLAGAAAEATDYRFVPGGANDWWMTTTNWDPEGVPNSINDVAIFDASGASAYSTNVHNLYFVIREMRFATGSTWRIYNDRQDPTLRAPEGEIALITQNGAGAVTFDTDLVFNSNTVFGGTGTGNITVNSSGNALYKETLRGPGGLTMNGNYTLALNLPVSYQGPTVINAGAVLFNGDTLAPVFDGSTVVDYTPVTLAPVTVNGGGTLGGTGTLRSPVTVNAGGSFAPGAGGPGVFTIDHNLALAAGSNTLIDLGGTSPGNGTGFHDQTIVTGQLRLGGTLQVAMTGGHSPGPGNSYRIMEYGSLDPAASQFDAFNYSIPNWPAHYRLLLDHGSGTNSAVTLSAAAVYYYTGGHSTYDYWEYADNWDPQEQPGVQASRGDVVIFDESRSSRNVTNIWNRDRYVREVQFDTTGTWRLYHNHYTLHLHNPDSGIVSRFAQNNSGAIRLDCDTRLDTDTVFGGTGTGTVTIYGRAVESATHGLRQGLFGPGGLTKEGAYTLTLENYASYEGPTIINGGALLFNAQSAKPNPDFDAGDTDTWTWVPATLAPVTVNNGGTLGGTGTLRAPVTVNSGGSLAPGAGGPGVLNIDGDLTLAAGSNTLIELGGTSPGNGSAFHDQAVVTGQLSLGGTLGVSLHGSHVPNKGNSYAILQYGSLDPNANAFDAINSPTSGMRANYRFVADYGSGANDAVTLSVTALPHYYTRGHAANDWWGLTENWSHGIVPGENPNEGDVVVFALTGQTTYSVNTHQGNPYTVKELRIEGTSNWRFYNPVRDIGLRNPEAGGSALFTHDGSGTVTLDCDLVMIDDTIFGGTGSGTISINGSPFHIHPTTPASSQGPGEGVIGAGGLTKNSDYTLVINAPASYQGETVVNAGTLLFNGQSAQRNPDWVEDEPDTYYNPVTMAPVAVNDGGTLGGTGILRAPVAVRSGGILSPGASAGIFTVDSLTLEPGAVTHMELGGLAAGNGDGFHDQVVVTDLLRLGGTLELSLLGNFEPTVGDTFVLFQYGSLDPTHNAFDSLSIPFAGEFVLNYGSGVNSQVILRAVPEPGALTLLLLGIGVLLAYRRRG